MFVSKLAGGLLQTIRPGACAYLLPGLGDPCACTLPPPHYTASGIRLSPLPASRLCPTDAAASPLECPATIHQVTWFCSLYLMTDSCKRLARMPRSILRLCLYSSSSPVHLLWHTQHSVHCSAILLTGKMRHDKPIHTAGVYPCATHNRTIPREV